MAQLKPFNPNWTAVGSQQQLNVWHITLVISCKLAKSKCGIDDFPYFPINNKWFWWFVLLKAMVIFISVLHAINHWPSRHSEADDFAAWDLLNGLIINLRRDKTPRGSNADRTFGSSNFLGTCLYHLLLMTFSLFFFLVRVWIFSKHTWCVETDIMLSNCAAVWETLQQGNSKTYTVGMSCRYQQKKQTTWPQLV